MTTWTVREDGTYTVVGERGVSEGKIQIVRGGLTFESSQQSGTLALEERDGKQIMNVAGALKRAGQTVIVELVRKRVNRRRHDLMISRASLVPILGLLSLLAAGCAPAVHVPLKAEDAGKIQGTRVRAVVVQEEINAAVQQSNIAAAGGGGLLLGLIDPGLQAHRTSKAKTLLEPIRPQLT